MTSEACPFTNVKDTFQIVAKRLPIFDSPSNGFYNLFELTDLLDPDFSFWDWSMNLLVLNISVLKWIEKIKSSSYMSEIAMDFL